MIDNPKKQQQSKQINEKGIKGQLLKPDISLSKDKSSPSVELVDSEDLENVIASNYSNSSSEKPNSKNACK
jgi:hypothetical protein